MQVLILFWVQIDRQLYLLFVFILGTNNFHGKKSSDKSVSLIQISTNFNSLACKVLHDKVAQPMRRRLNTAPIVIIHFKTITKRFGPYTKLSSKDEMLMTLMKLQLELH